MKKLRFLIAIALAALFACMFTLAACSKAALAAPKGFDIDEDNTLSWEEVADARQYELDILNAETGERESTTTRRNYYSLSELAEGDYEIKVKAIGGSHNALYSDWSETVDFHKDFETGLIYKKYNQNTEYYVEKVGTATGSVTLEGVYRGKPVTAIADGAFRASNRIKELIIEDNVQYVGEKAFYNCPALERVDFPDTVTYIGPATFQVCGKLKSVRLPAHLQAIPDYMFAYCRNLGEIILPEELIYIAESAFYSCSALKEITIPDSVQSIYKFAFEKAEALQTVNFGSGLRSVGEEAFCGELALKTINFKTPETTLSLGKNSFANCPELESVEFPEGLTSLGEQAFYTCTKLKEVKMPESLSSVGAFVFNGTQLFADQEDNGFIYAGDWLVATTEAKREDLGKNTDGTVDASAFSGKTVGIAGNVFIGCANLTKMTVPQSVKYICANAFYGASLNSFRVDDSDGDGKNSLISIGEAAFRGCKSLSNLRLGEGLQTIESYAFRDCEMLNNNSVDISASFIPSTVTRIGTYAFNGTGLYKAPVDGVIYAGDWVVGYDTAEQKATINFREGTKSIADYAFYNDESLMTVNLSRITNIGRGAFMGCTQLRIVSFNNNLKSIKENTFRGCSSLNSVDFGNNLETIERYAFSECESLPTVDLAVTEVTSIGVAAFNCCSALTEVIFPGIDTGEADDDTLTEIADYAFYSCKALQSVALPDSVQSLGERAFALCDGILNVDLGEGLQTIGRFAFKSLPSLTKITIPDSVKTIGEYAFYDCPSVISLDLGKGVEDIGAYAFAYSSITSLTLPASVKTIGRYAFKNCEKLTYASIKQSVERIDANAFYGCYFLTLYSDGSSADLWSGRWNSSFCPIVWGCEFAEEGYIVSFVAGDITNPYSFFGFGAPAREGYEFVGWSYEAGSRENLIDARDIDTVAAGTRLYAVWQEYIGEISG